ncbi:MAG: DUF4405 domain-containing protein [Paenirhodobacter sp.]
MLKLRSWATPLVIGSFLIMAVTGVLMFFHLDTATMKTIHEWAGLVMVAGAIAHVILNWRAFSLYFKRPLAAGIMALGAVVLAVTFVPNVIPGVVEGAGLGPKVVMDSMGNARIETLSELSGKPVDQLMSEFEAAGLTGIDPAKTVKANAGGDGGKLREILAVALVPKS